MEVLPPYGWLMFGFDEKVHVCMYATGFIGCGRICLSSSDARSSIS